MSVTICTPKELSIQEKNEILNLVNAGGQILSNGLEERLMRSIWIAYKKSDEGKIVATASIKKPNQNYKQDVFKQAKAPNENQFSLELGYIVTHRDCEGKGYCREVLNALIPMVKGPIYATTRKDSMIHILKKYNFKESGSIYKNDLVLMVRGS